MDDLPSRRPTGGGFDPEGWEPRSFRVLTADVAGSLPGLRDLALRVRYGAMPRSTPVFVGTRRTDSPYPDVRVGVPLDDETVRLMQQGNRAAAKDALDALQDAFDAWWRDVLRSKGDPEKPWLLRED